MRPIVRLGRRALLRARWRVEEAREHSRLLAGPPVVELTRVARRLELLLAALHGRSFAIGTADRAPEAGWLRRYVLHSPGRRAPSHTLARHDGERILLPRALDAAQGEDAAVARYRVLALEQAERMARGTTVLAPAGAPPLVRDLYLLGEAVAVDRRLADTVRVARPALDAMRAAALARRPPLATLTRAEREVERLVRRALAGDPPVPEAAATPAASLAWALEQAERIGPDARYRGVRPVAHWGSWRLAPGQRLEERARGDRDLPPLPSAGLPTSVGLPQGGGAGGRDADTALAAGRAGEATAQVSHTEAAPRWVRDRDGANGRTTGGAGETPPATEQRPAGPDEPPPGTVAEWHGDPFAEPARGPLPSTPGIPYPEWDHVTGRYRADAVTVRVTPATVGDASWAHEVLGEHAALVRTVRQRFGRMRARRLRHHQQRQGEELDLAACVRALVERRAGQSPDDRLYQTVRAARPTFAIALLADVSGSTKAPVTDGRRMIDVEKLALLLAGEALAALGDRYAVLAFAGHGAADVRVTALKAFGEANGEAVRQRIAALEPGGFTRLGAAMRHATAVLAREPVRHRLLLVLSDGRPNDVGHYVAEYGLEDSRQAVHEARAQAIYPFCLNVDRDRPEYLAHIFGPAGYTTLWRPDQLPRALLQAVRTLIVS
ncbi:MAG TPA: VWA domain-containing protein [Gemmatimonadaceae bacterium]|nr:VWA domain-containing protein [Gemmatimonadaceae bacterium]